MSSPARAQLHRDACDRLLIGRLDDVDEVVAAEHRPLSRDGRPELLDLLVHLAQPLRVALQGLHALGREGAQHHERGHGDPFGRGVRRRGMYPLGMTRSLAVAAGLVALAAPATASAASLSVSPQKRCYSSGETLNLMGADFSPLGNASITRDGTALGSLKTDANGGFTGILTVAQTSGKRTKTYTATDDAVSTLSASAQITVSAVRVDLSPANGAPGRRMSIKASGFATGKTLWAHVTKGKSRRTLKIGDLSGACGGLKTRKRLLPRNAAVGVHTIQFDTFRKYNRKQPVNDRYTVTVSRG